MDIIIILSIFIITFIISVTIIFIPKDQHYHNDVYPELKNLKKSYGIIRQNLVNICGGDEFNITNGAWSKFPDNVKGDVGIIPLYMHNKPSKYFTKELYDILCKYGVISAYFIKLGKKSEILPRIQFKSMNKTLQAIHIIDSNNYSMDKCGIVVSSYSKSLKNNNIIVYDSSKEHSLYNNTNDIVYLLVLDLPRPYSIPIGQSKKNNTIELDNLIKDINYFI